MKTRVVINAHIPDPDHKSKINFYQVEREYKSADGEIAVQPIAKVIVGNGLSAKGALILAKEILEDPTDVPNLPGVVDMRKSKAVPVYTLEAPGPDGWSRAPEGLR